MHVACVEKDFGYLAFFFCILYNSNSDNVLSKLFIISTGLRLHIFLVRRSQVESLAKRFYKQSKQAN